MLMRNLHIWHMYVQFTSLFVLDKGLLRPSQYFEDISTHVYIYSHDCAFIQLCLILQVSFMLHKKRGSCASQVGVG